MDTRGVVGGRCRRAPAEGGGAVPRDEHQLIESSEALIICLPGNRYESCFAGTAIPRQWKS
jgi:hypothetical protein